MYASTILSGFTVCCLIVTANGLQCMDWQGKLVPEGTQFLPDKNDPCMTCICEDGFPVMCTSVMCSPPECQLVEQVEGECCEFNCLKPADAPTDQKNNVSAPFVPEDPKQVEEVDTANLGLRLVASTVTSFLILALLLFMVHRLRQRRILVMMRRMNAERAEDDEAVAYMSQFDGMDFGGIDFPPYEEPPPPYTPPKPADIPPGEAPPPYEPGPVFIGGNLGQEEPNNNRNQGSGVRPVQGSNTGDEPPQENQSEMHEVQEIQGSQSSTCLLVESNSSEFQLGGVAHENMQTSECGFATLETVDTNDSTERDVGQDNVSQSGLSQQLRHSSSNSGADNYGLSVAVATVGTPPSQRSPSHVIVRLHNNNPRSSVLRSPAENLDLCPPLYTPQESKKPGPWSQYIKRSNSIEIRRGSNSPRNSYYTDRENDGASGSTTDASTGSLRPPYAATGGPLCNESHSQRQSPQGDPNVSVAWNKSNKPFRIPGQPDPETVLKQEHGMQLNTNGLGSQAQHKHSSMHESDRGSDQLLVDLSQSGPPEVASAASAILPNNDAMSSLNSEASGVATRPRPNRPQTLSSNGHILPQGSRARVGDSSSPQSSASGSLSPQSPGVMFVPRSGSGASQVSQFSVCSETGEKKRPKLVAVPIAIGNDVAQYPLSPHSCTCPQPVYPSIPRGAVGGSDPWNSLNDREDSGRVKSPDKSGSNTAERSPDSQSPQESIWVKAGPLSSGRHQADSGNVASGTSSKKSPPSVIKPPRICYVDSNCNITPEDINSKSRCAIDADEEREQAQSDARPRQAGSSSPRANHNDCPERLLNGVGKSDSQERNTVRKVKQKKRRSKEGNPGPAENLCNGDVGNVVNGELRNGTPGSPERHKRVSRSGSAGSSFKEYGFIDDPAVLKSREVTPTSPTQERTNWESSRSRDSSKERAKRDSSHERHRRDTSEEKKKRSDSRDKYRSAGSRDSSSNRDSRNSSAERNKRRPRTSSSEGTRQRASSGESGRGASDCRKQRRRSSGSTGYGRESSGERSHDGRMDSNRSKKKKVPTATLR